MKASTHLPILFRRIFSSELLYILIIGTSIRVALAGTRSFFGDESSTLRIICLPITYILTHFDLWQTMNFYLVLEKIIARVLGDGLLAMRLISILADVGSIVTIYFLSGRIFPQTPRYIAVTLYAINPHLIDFSATARVYSLFVFLALLTILAFLAWYNHPKTRWRLAFSILCCIMLLFHLGGSFLIVWFGCMVAVHLAITAYKKNFFKEQLQEALRLLATLLLCISPAIVYYGMMWNQIREHNAFEYKDADFGLVQQIPAILKIFIGIEIPWLLSLCAILAVLGLLNLTLHHRHWGTYFSLLLLLPFVISKALGYSYPPHYLARFIIFVMPVVILCLAWGIALISSCAPLRMQQWVRLLCVAGIIASATPKIIALFDSERVFPYRHTARFLKQQLAEQDKILCDGFFIFLHLSCYFPCSNRSFETRCSAPDLIIEKNLETHLQRNHNGRLFLVTISPQVAECGTVVGTFGKLLVSVLPEESREARMQRMISCWSTDAEAFSPDIDCSKANLYDLLRQIYAAQGATDASVYYADAVKKCFQERESRWLQKFGATKGKNLRTE